jgi:hypothetical protein
MIKALSNSCGSGVSGSRTVVIDYQLKMWLKIFSATIKPSFDSSATIDCPLDADQIAQLMPTT